MARSDQSLDTSAAEIANYRGNAAAAVGSTEGGATGVTTLWGLTDATGALKGLDKIAAANLAKNKDIYEQKIKDRDELFDKLASKEMQMDKMLPKDRDMVREKYLKPIRDMLIENPDLKSDPDQYVKFQSLTNDFEEAKIYGQHRFTQLTALDQLIAAETDPEKLKRMKEHRAASEAQDIFTEVKPYQQVLDWSEAMFPVGKPVSTKTQELVGDKIVTTTHTRTPAIDFKTAALHNYTDSPNKSLANEMDLYRKQFLEMTDNDRAEKIYQWNDMIARVNKDEGSKQGDLNWIEPIAFTTAKDANGVEHVTTLETAPRLALAQGLLKGYVNSRTPEEQISLLPSQIKENEAQTKKQLAEMGKIPAETAKIWADVAKTRAETEKVREEVAAAKAATGDKKANGDYLLNQVIATFDEKTYKNLPDVQADKLDKNGKPVLDKNGKPVKIDIDGKLLAYQEEDKIAIDPATGKPFVDEEGKPTGKKVAGNLHAALSEVEMKALAAAITYTTGQVDVQPTRVIYNNTNKKDPFFALTYKVNFKDGSSQLKTRMVRPHQYTNLLLTGNAGSDTKALSENKSHFNDALKRRTGGKQNIDANVGNLALQPDYNRDYVAPPTKTEKVTIEKARTTEMFETDEAKILKKKYGSKYTSDPIKYLEQKLQQDKVDDKLTQQDYETIKEEYERLKKVKEKYDKKLGLAAQADALFE